MTPERFAALAAAYGGQINRWPETEREAAHALLAHPRLREMLEREAGLDDVLATWSAQTGTTAPPPGRIAAHVTERRDSLRRARFWLSGLGATGALAAGAAAGILAVALSASPPRETTASIYSLTVLGAPLDDTAAEH